jgi:hypothetical protein
MRISDQAEKAVGSVLLAAVWDAIVARSAGSEGSDDHGGE